MNGPSKDAGVERLRAAFMRVQANKRAQRFDLAPVTEIVNLVPEILSLLDHHADFERDLAAEEVADHPPVDQAAEEVAGRLEGLGRGRSEADRWYRDARYGPNYSYLKPEETHEWKAATLIRSMSARIAELEGALEKIKRRTEDWPYMSLGANIHAIAVAALAPSVASETRTDETRDRREVGR